MPEPARREGEPKRPHGSDLFLPRGRWLLSSPHPRPLAAVIAAEPHTSHQRLIASRAGVQLGHHRSNSSRGPARRRWRLRRSPRFGGRPMWTNRDRSPRRAPPTAVISGVLPCGILPPGDGAAIAQCKLLLVHLVSSYVSRVPSTRWDGIVANRAFEQLLQKYLLQPSKPSLLPRRRQRRRLHRQAQGRQAPSRSGDAPARPPVGGAIPNQA